MNKPSNLLHKVDQIELRNPKRRLTNIQLG